ncbi:hypothetical protein DID88_003190 [Monilinia fructigena]|uniref:Uncharacterized protein n=1 Tax=Monilinia fructigena TaxID=38457 RepID=A0A395IUR1_9HELO|nr:hypothetical protein DID88_003190 [Monilinia fructigena]
MPHSRRNIAMVMKKKGGSLNAFKSGRMLPDAGKALARKTTLNKEVGEYEEEEEDEAEDSSCPCKTYCREETLEHEGKDDSSNTSSGHCDAGGVTALDEEEVMSYCRDTGSIYPSIRQFH